MGNEVGAYPSDGEGPVRPVHLSPFALSSTAVPATEVATFVDATGYRDVAHWFSGIFPNANLVHHAVTNISWEDAKAYAE